MGKGKQQDSVPLAVPKFKPSTDYVIVVPATDNNFKDLSTRQCFNLLRVLLAFETSKTPFDFASVADYESLSGLSDMKALPKPFVHCRSKDFVLFDASAVLSLFCGPVCGELATFVEGILAVYGRLGVEGLASEGICKTAAFSGSQSDAITAFALCQVIPAELARLLPGAQAAIEKSFSAEAFGPQLKALIAFCKKPSGTLPSPAVLDETIILQGTDSNSSSVVRPATDGETRNILITSALPYVNNVPHLGNIVGAVLSADVYARYCRLVGHRTVYVCGTDEYGTATETKAMQEGLSCQTLCDKYFREHAAIYKWFGIEFDAFGRTPTALHTAITHEIFEPLYRNGYFVEQSMDQCYCEKCATFRSDRYVEGKCPLCGFDDARGDQCDGCGKLLNAVELLGARCKMCSTATAIRASTHLFLDLSKLQPEVEKFVEAAGETGAWSSNSLAITRAWLTEGLKPRCMTRDLKWGTSVPLPGYEEKVFYVWFDAPIGYISITANYDPEGWRLWWQDGGERRMETEKGSGRPVELVQFMGKDNVPFHTVMFPATLLGTRQPWTLLNRISTTEYLNYEGGKFSKSRGSGVFGSDARNSNIPPALWRYYLLATRPETMDAAFSWADFAGKANGELLANVGNFVNRTARFVVSKLGGVVPEAELIAADAAFIAEKLDPELLRYHEEMEAVKLRAALKTAMAVSAAGNLYLTEQRLDGKLLAGEPKRCATVLAVSLNIAYVLSALLDPFMPSVSEGICEILALPRRRLPRSFSLVIRPGHCLNPSPFHLFEKVDEALIEQLKCKFAGSDGSVNGAEAAKKKPLS
jgi:methionyl-tRNA synthetase